MAEDKYAPKPGENTKQVHHLHRQLIKDQQEENRKLRQQAAQRKAAPPQDEKSEKNTNQTQPAAAEQPQNPEAPANQPAQQ